MFQDCICCLVNATNVKNMHPHRDSNPGPWNTVMLFMFDTLSHTKTNETPFTQWYDGCF